MPLTWPYLTYVLPHLLMHCVAQLCLATKCSTQLMQSYDLMLLYQHGILVPSHQSLFFL